MPALNDESRSMNRIGSKRGKMETKQRRNESHSAKIQQPTKQRERYESHNNGDHRKHIRIEYNNPQYIDIHNILHKAKIPLPPKDNITQKTISIPTHQNISNQYGPLPLLPNLSTACSTFRKNTPLPLRMMGVAGLFNTGTNYLSALLEKNCNLPNRSSHSPDYPFREQVPYGKHNPPSTHRGIHSVRGQEGVVDQNYVLPVVVVKDPFHWMVSNCRHEYFLWDHEENHCPNLVDYREEEVTVPVSFEVKYGRETRRYDSLVELWNSWYGEYVEKASLYPVVFVRFEDLIFHAEYVIGGLCECIGGDEVKNVMEEFEYLEESAKSQGIHAGANGFLGALLRYGDPEKRLEGWTIRDWEYAAKFLDDGLMKKFGYNFPSWQ